MGCDDNVGRRAFDVLSYKCNNNGACHNGHFTDDRAICDIICRSLDTWTEGAYGMSSKDKF